ncbi:MAG: aldose epimerase family protein [Planctomycetota bacterium]|nr:aldose epimerase family protein [Planctomycetota bacterium]
MHRSSMKLLTAALVIVLSGIHGSWAHLEAVDRHGTMHVEQSPFGTTADGQSVELFTCTNAGGVKLRMMTYGAIVVSLEVPDRDGTIANVNLGYEKLDGYLAGSPYFGATVGRYCNRIAGGMFRLDGKQYTLATNNGSNHLHGGDVGYDKVVWEARPIRRRSEVGVRFQYTSKDGEEGYPGTVQITATYTLTNENELKVELRARSDAATPVNLTNHCYWNLAGAGSGSILDHQLQVESDEYLAVDDTLIPTGNMVAVKGSPLDFTSPHAIGERLKQIPEIEGLPQGYDHCFVVRRGKAGLALAARVTDPSSGRTMEIYTTQPGLQFYSGNFLDGTDGSGGFQQYEGFCLETQHYPDSPNQPGFPSTILYPGKKYQHTTVHAFSAR